MKSRSLLICLLLTMPAAAPGASKEILELQRDIAQLQQQLKDLQRSQDEKFAAVTELARQSIEAANRAFAPAPEALTEARAVKDAFALPENAGKGVIALNGRMVERLHLAQAEKLLAKAAAIGA